MHLSKQNSTHSPTPKKPSKFGNKIKSRVNTRIVSVQTPILQTLNHQFPIPPPLTPISNSGFQFPPASLPSECDLTESTSSFCLKRNKSVKFDDVPVAKMSTSSSSKKLLPVSILKNTLVEKDTASILSGSRNLLSNSSFCSNANTQRSKLSAADSVVEDQRQVMVERNKYSSTLENCIYHKKKYFDDIFPPGSSSLYSRHQGNKYGEVKWVRIGDLFTNHKQYIYSYHKTLKSNIFSGYVQIPYLLTCFQSLDTNTRCLERIFEDQKPNETGIYCLRIFLNGVWKYVIVDDFIPTVIVGGRQTPLFVNVAGRKKDIVNIWPLLLLKAYAKVYSSYECLEDGTVFDFMNELTGASVEKLYINESSIEKLGKYYNSTDYMIVLGKKVDNEMRYFPSDNGRDQTFMISNFLSESPLITVNNTKITLSQLDVEYQQAIIVKLDELHLSVSCTIHQSKQTLSIRSFKTSQVISCHFSLIQKDRKYYRNKYKYSWVRLIVGMKESEGVRYVAGGMGDGKAIHLECSLEPGEYYLVVIADWADKVYNMSLTYNGPVPITIERKTQKDAPNVFEEACADIAQRFGDFKQLSPNLCSYRCFYSPLGLLIENLNNQNRVKDIAIIKAYGDVLEEVKMKGRVKCFEKGFVEEGYTLTKRVKPKDHFTLVMMLPGEKAGWKRMEYFSFDQ